MLTTDTKFYNISKDDISTCGVYVCVCVECVVYVSVELSVGELERVEVERAELAVLVGAPAAVPVRAAA